LNDETTCTILVLCTGNSSRSLIGEALINHLGGGRFKAYSAGSDPAGKPNPYALQVLKSHGVPVEGLRSKSWDEFAEDSAAKMDAVITVCDNAAAEVCPIWPGAPAKCHWGLPDPAAVQGSDEAKKKAFEKTYAALEKRVRKLVALPPESLRPENLAESLQALADEG